MLRKDKRVIAIFYSSIVILSIIYLAIILINFLTKDSITKESIVGINPINRTKSIMTYQEPLTVILEEQEKKLLSQQKESEEISKDIDKIVENQEIEEEFKEHIEIETKILPEEQIEDSKKETIIEVAEDVKQTEEMPESVLTEYKSFATVGKIEIPQTRVDIPILDQVTVEGMKNAPCLLYSTGKLNENGNNLIVGHNFRDGTIFSNNKYLKLGDKIYITTLNGKRVEYTIYNKFITTAEDVSYIKRNTNNKPEITLSCCTDDDEHRIIILARI